MKFTTTIACSVALLGCGVSLARADEVPQNTLRIGYYFVFFDSSSDPVTGQFIPGPPLLTQPLNLKANNVNTPYVGYIRRLSAHWDAELAFGVPPKTEIVGKGPAALGNVPYNGQVLGSAKWVAPTVLFEYKFLSEDAPVRPYMGLGVNYTAFVSRQSSPAGNAVSGGPTAIDQTASIGPAGTVGLKFSFGRNWNAIASANYSAVKTNLTLTTAGVERTAHISFNPFAAVVALGYSF